MIPVMRPTLTLADWRAAMFPPRGAVAQFEHELAARFGMKHALVFPFGRTAIHATFRALNLAGEIVQPAYNCVVVAHATVLSGNRPIFVDCRRETPNQDADAIIDAVNDRTAAVVPTSIFGMTFDAPALVAGIRRKNPNAFVLIDCAQSFDAHWQGELIAAQGDAAILAFGIGKAMTTLFGGAVLTNRDDVADRILDYRARSFRQASAARSFNRLLYMCMAWLALTGIGARITDYAERSRFLHTILFKGFRSREMICLPRDHQTWMTNREAAIGSAQLPHLSAFIQRRREISAIYARELRDARGVKLPEWQAGSTHTIYTVRLDDPLRRARILDALRRAGVQGGMVLDYVVPDLECYRERGIAGDFPNARDWAARVLNLPNHPTLTHANVLHCATALRDALNE